MINDLNAKNCSTITIDSFHKNLKRKLNTISSCIQCLTFLFVIHEKSKFAFIPFLSLIMCFQTFHNQYNHDKHVGTITNKSLERHYYYVYIRLYLSVFTEDW